MITLQGLNKSDVLACLYNESRPLGMGFANFDPKPMERQEAEELLAQSPYFDYLKGRAMKIDLSGDTLDPYLYDRDNGSGAAQRAIAELLRTSQTNTTVIADAAKQGVREAAATAAVGMTQRGKLEKRDGCEVYSMGLADVADVLRPKIDEALKSVS